MTPRPEWHIITCEFPPDIGGVGDYSLTIAQALIESGCDVHVWCNALTPASSRPERQHLFVHAVPGAFTPSGLRRLGRQLNATSGRRRLFVQWVPHGYGYRSMNIFFALWLAARACRRHDSLQILVHEPFLAFSLAPRQFAAALVHRMMMTLACFGADRVWMSTPAWAPMITPFLAGRVTPRWLPIPAVGGVATDDTPADDVRRPAPGRAVVGHFSTHSPVVTGLLEPAIAAILTHPDIDVLLIGRDSERFRQRCLTSMPWAASRIRATGTIPAHALRAYVASCDVMLQPFPDGVSARRTSVLAMLAVGAVVVTNAGTLTEPLWHDGDGLALVPSPDPARLAESTVSLVRDPAARARIRTAALGLYDRLFHVRRSIELLLASQDAA